MLHDDKENFLKVLEATSAQTGFPLLLLEKDYYLTMILSGIGRLSENLIFKGGDLPQFLGPAAMLVMLRFSWVAEDEAEPNPEQPTSPRTYSASSSSSDYADARYCTNSAT